MTERLTTDEALEFFQQADEELDTLKVTLTTLSKHREIDYSEAIQQLAELQNSLERTGRNMYNDQIHNDIIGF